MLNKTKLKLLFVSFVLLLSLTAVSANENNTFTDLQTAIDESGNEVNINRDYAYNNTADGKYGDGIVISNRELVINGNGYAFDGSDQARILLVNPHIFIETSVSGSTSVHVAPSSSEYAIPPLRFSILVRS